MYKEQKYLDHNLNHDLDREILSFVNTRSWRQYVIVDIINNVIY